MAGIGFRIQKLVSGESFSDLIRAYLYSAMISAGPMLIVIVTLSILKIFLQMQLAVEETKLFMGVVVYVYAYSMIMVSPFLYVVTRYIADKYYLKELDAFTPVFLSVCELIFFIQTIVALWFLYPLPLQTDTKLMIYILYLVVSGTWIAMIFLSAASGYLWIVMAFLIGCVGGVGLGLWFGFSAGFDGFLLGFTTGQATTFFILAWRIFAEFGYHRDSDYGFITYLKRNPYLIGVGVFYYLGIWVDKLIFWYSSQGEKIIGNLSVFSTYDTPMFVAYLTIVPSMAFFLIQMETDFAASYQTYYKNVRTRSNLRDILTKKRAMVDTLTGNFQKFVIFQGIISALVIIFVYEISSAFYLNPLQMGIFRIGILGAFLQMGFIMMINILFYYDCQFEVCLASFLFLVLNTVGTLLSLAIGLPAYGFGYTFAGFVSLIVAYLMIHRRLIDLEYWTFMRQPILVPRFKLEAEKIKDKAQGK